MRKQVIVLALAMVMAVSLTACMGSDDNKDNTTGSGSVTNGQVSRRYSSGAANDSRTYFDDGRYTAGSNGHVYNNGEYAARDLTRDARDIARDAGDAIGDMGRDIGELGRDLVGAPSGTPSWEPSSGARY